MRLGDFYETTPDSVSNADVPEWVTVISQLASQGMSLYQQLQLQEMNMDLIRQGKPPLTAYQMASMAPQLNVGVSKDTQMMLLLAVGAVGLTAVMVAGIKTRGAR